MYNKRGQIAETVTWLIATVVIIVILTISIFVAQLTFGNKGENLFFKETDPLAKESLFAYLSTEVNGKIIYEQFGQEDFDDRGLSEKVFNEFYDKDYQIVSLRKGFNVNGCFGLNVRENLLEKVFLNEKECVELNLWIKKDE